MSVDVFSSIAALYACNAHVCRITGKSEDRCYLSVYLVFGGTVSLQLDVAQ